MKKFFIVLGIALVAMGAAYAETPQHTIRGGLLYVSPTGSEDVDLFDYTIEGVEVDSSWGLAFSYEYRFNDMLGLEGGLAWSKHEFSSDDDTGDDNEDTSMMPLSLALNIHPVKDSNVDFYFGPVIAWVMYDDIDIDDDLKVEADNDIAWGVQLGLDYPLNDQGLAFNAGLKYMMTKYKADVTFEGLDIADSKSSDEFEIDVNPWIVQIGLAYRF